MGRSRFGSIVTRPFVSWPMVRTFADAALGADLTTGVNQPISPGGSGSIPSQWQSFVTTNVGVGTPPGLRTARAWQVTGWSVTDVLTAAGSIYPVTAAMSGSNILVSNGAIAEQALAVGGHQAGLWIYTGGRGVGDPLGAGPFLSETAVANPQNHFLNVNNDPTGQVRGAFLNPVLCPAVPCVGTFVATNGPRFMEWYRPVTHHPGPVRGFYFTFPLLYGTQSGQASGVVNINQADIVVRRMLAPMAMRVVGVILGASASAAGATLKVRNVTLANDITSATAVTSASPSAVWIPASSLQAGGRNIARGDVITVQATTGAGGGMTDPYAVVVAYTTGFPTDDGWRDLPMSRLNADSMASQRQETVKGFRTRFSGPVAGGLLTLPFEAGTIAISQTDAPISRSIAPATGRVLGIGFATGGSGAGNSLTLYNVTKARAIHTDTQLVGAGGQANANEATGFPTQLSGNPEVEAGDVLELRATTGGTSGFTRVGANVLMHAREHVNSNPIYD